jgi:hypothetical protein
MPRHKKSYTEDELLPAPDREWFNDLLIGSEFGTVADLSAAATTSGDRNLLGRALNRGRRLKLNEAVRISQLLNVPIRELLESFGYVLPRVKVPVVGRVNAGGTVFLREKPSGFVPGPDDLNRKLRCVILESEGSALAAWDRFSFFFEEHTRPAPNAYERLAIVKPTDAKRPLMGVMPRSAGKHGALIPFGSTEPIEILDVEWSAPVLWIKCTG